VAKVLLIETQPGVREALAELGHDVDHTTLGSDDNPAIDPREYQVIVNDWLNADSYLPTRKREMRGILRPRPVAPEVTPAAVLSVGHIYRSDLLETLRAGALMVTFVGPQYSQPLNGFDGEEWERLILENLQREARLRRQPEPRQISNFDSIPTAAVVADLNLYDGSTSIRLSAPDEWTVYLEGYAARFGRHLRWHASWAVPRDNYITCLFRSATDRCVGFAANHLPAGTYRVGPNAGLNLVLPNIDEPKRRAEAIHYLVDEVLPLFRPQFFPEHWISVYEPATLAAKRAQFSERRARILEGLAQEEASLNENAAQIHEYQSLLRLTGDPLKDAVAEVFRDRLGFDVVDLDAATPQGEPKRADLLLGDGDFQALVEVKGSTSANVRQENTDFFLKHIRQFELENGPLHARVLIFNGQARLAPEQREPFHPDRVKDARANKITLLSTVHLLDLLAQHFEGELGMADLKRMLSTPGAMG
jgi:hypothetical protein